MCVCVRACTRVYVCVWPMYTCTRVLLARSTFRVSVVSFCALSAVLGLSQPPRECERARTHIATLLCTTRHVSLSLSLFLSFAFSLSPFLSYSLVNLDLASILSGCVLFSRVRTRRSVAGQARGRGERRENAGEREREVDGGPMEEKKGRQEPRGSIGGHRPPQKSAHHRHQLPFSSFSFLVPPLRRSSAAPYASSSSWLTLWPPLCPLGPTVGAGARRPLYKYLPWNVKQFASY